MKTLKKNYEFRRLYSKGKSAVSPFLVVYCRQNGTPDNRIGYTVSTKLGHAVVRNRVRRRLREIYRLNHDRFHNGMDIVVVARSRSVTAQYAQLEKSFLNCCSRLGMLKAEGK